MSQKTLGCKDMERGNRKRGTAIRELYAFKTPLHDARAGHQDLVDPLCIDANPVASNGRASDLLDWKQFFEGQSH